MGRESNFVNIFVGLRVILGVMFWHVSNVVSNLFWAPVPESNFESNVLA